MGTGRMPRRRIAMARVGDARFLAATGIVLLLSVTGGARAEELGKANVDVPTAAVIGSAASTKNATADELNAQPATPARAAVATPAPSPNPGNSAGEDADTTKPAVAPSAAIPAAPIVADADTAIAEQLRELANGHFDGIIGNKQDRTTIDAFYSGRNYAPLWIADGKPNSHATAAIAYLGKVDADGLDPADYPVPDFAAPTDPVALAEAEIRLTTSVIAYAHHASIGRVHWSRVSGDIFYDQKAPEPADVLAAMVSATDVGEALDAYEPHAPAYLALKAKLADLRVGKNTGKPPIPAGPAPKVGAQDNRVPALRDRLGVSGDGSTVYDKALAEAVRKFQQQRQIAATGTLTAATIAALNGKDPDRPIDIVIANMERWRWMPRDLGQTYVIVNLADFMLHVIHDGKEVWSAKVVDGKPTTPTPIMSGAMKYITVNPTWNVPDSIAANEYIPLLRQDPTILQRMGLNVTHNPDGALHISQPPGDDNALGRLRFNFPNKFLVYQHDSNQKYMFADAMRARSHGCMRVQDPLKYAEVLLSLVRPGEGYSEDRIRRMYGHNEQDIQFPTFIPVHLTYQTAFVDDEGKLQFRDDVYGRDKALLAILKSDERKVADIAIERKDNAVRREALAMPEQAWGGWSGQNFFSRLFGNSFAAPPPPAAPRRHEAQRRTDVH
jgi:murein L,D-transpeptidase YcbB/YkuD